jgi:hypothetical protein
MANASGNCSETSALANTFLVTEMVAILDPGLM